MKSVEEVIADILVATDGFDADDAAQQFVQALSQAGYRIVPVEPEMFAGKRDGEWP